MMISFYHKILFVMVRLQDKSGVMIKRVFFFIFFLHYLLVNNVFSQTKEICIVDMSTLKGKYSGDCKNGFANGKGSAEGIHKYSGNFKSGFPDGKGVYHYNDSTFYAGNFQAGLREGKGEMHHFRNGVDSIIKGYWSGDVYRGKRYVTYTYNTSQSFDIIEIIPSEQIGNTITFQVSTTSGSPDGTLTNLSNSGFTLTVNDVIALDQTFIRKLSDFASGNKYFVTYQINSFPARLFITFSNSRTMEMDLYKAAKWSVRLYVNK